LRKPGRLAPTARVLRHKPRSHRKHLRGFAFLLPALGIYLLFVIFPLAASLWGSLFEWHGLQRGASTGLANFTRLFDGANRDRVTGAFMHNVLWFAGIMFVQNVLGLIIAYVLFLRGPRYSFFQSVFFLPAIFSPVIVGALWRLLLAPRGPAESALNGLGLHDGALTWLGDTRAALWVLIGVDIWNWIGLSILVFLAGFHAIPSDVFDAARVDGAGASRTLVAIALPLLIPSISTLTILTFINTFNQFDIVYVMQGVQGNPAHSTDVLVTYFYRLAFGAEGSVGITDIGLALALGSLLFLFLAVFSIIMLRYFERTARAL
jgi:raffinose/stachyose/melibiose transport system permease protein